MASERKRQANRRNAKRSTGPKDTRRTRYNAQKHGILSKAVIIQNGAVKENQQELDRLLEALRENLQPEGAMEEILVDRIASAYWRLRRALRAEAGEIGWFAGNTTADAGRSAARRADLILKAEKMSSVPGAVPGEGSLRELSKTTWGLAHVQWVLDMVRCLIEENGALTPEELTDLTIIYGRRGGRLALTIAALSITATDDSEAEDDEEPDRRYGGPPQDGHTKVLLASLDEELERIKEEAVLMAEREEFRRETSILVRHLPRGRVLEHILRYETAVDRQMYRALKELRELQVARRTR